MFLNYFIGKPVLKRITIKMLNIGANNRLTQIMIKIIKFSLTFPFFILFSFVSLFQIFIWIESFHLD